MSEQQIAEQIRDKVKDWVDGKVDKADFDKFLETSNAKLDELKAAKAAEDDRWWRISTSFYY